MYCPKCGKANPEDGKYCRKCGTGLGGVFGPESGNSLDREKMTVGNVSPANNTHGISQSKSKDTWELAIGSLFMGLAFLAIAGVLAFQPMGTGWWFWLLIPAFMMIGVGVAKIIRLQKGDFPKAVEFSAESEKQIESPDQSALPPKQMKFVSESEKPRYDTDQMSPPSVAEESTRLLEIEPDGKTTKLPPE